MKRLVVFVLLVSAQVAAAETRVAVLEFSNASAERDNDPLGKGLQSMLTTDLSQVPSLRLVERQRLRDIQAELKLGQGGQIDKATAARIGKLAGATHLLGGSFVIVGNRMRIDSRLFAVQSGDVVFAEKIEGERDAFFELEKQLAGKFIDSVGIKLQPRERAAMTKVHTADFEAFRKYSQGVAAFDDKRYSDALTLLGEATKLDKDFRLAATTLEEYVQLIGKLREKADVVDTVATAEHERRLMSEQSKQSQKWAAPIEALWKIAAASGGGQAQHDRLAATALLSLGYRNEFRLQFPRGDRFALERFADDLERRYVAEARPMFPKIPPLLDREAWSELKSGEPVEAWVRRTWDALEAAMKPPRLRRTIEALEREFGRCDHPDYEAAASHLLLDQAQTVQLAAQILDWIDKLDPGGKRRALFRERMAEHYRDVLELGKSTSLWAEGSAAAGGSHDLRRYADEIERNRKLLDMLQNSKNRELARETLLLEGLNASEVVQKFLSTAPPKPEFWPYLAGFRRFTHMQRAPMLIGDVPAWVVRAGHESDVETGPRTDARRADEIRYIPDVSYRKFNPGYDATPEALVMVDGRPRTDIKAQFQIRFAVPRELGKGLNESRGEPPRQRAEVGWAFGVQNAIGEVPAAASGFAVLLGGGKARLVEFQLVKDKEDAKVNHEVTRFALKSLEEHPLALSETADVQIVLKGARLEVRAGGRSVAFKAPTERGGFHGLMFRELGYAGVGALKVAAP
ncbi:MAG TPA: CsgG/HfaB family protein [Kofleriaceae bacterium]|nr:CsgG/HfaB family protein [Kofleriaceae bacterium]